MNRKKAILIILLILLIIISVIILNLIQKKTINNNNNDNNIEEIVQISTYDNPIVPTGFSKVETETASWQLNENNKPEGWNKGLVIEDEKGNQFVWVPVDNKESGYIIEELEENTWDDDLPKAVEDEKVQIIKYGGFYIARYEAGVAEYMQVDNTNINSMANNKIGVPVSKSGVRPWNYIEYKKAKQNAESMYDNDSYKSGLMTNAQYNTILNWLKNTGYELKDSYKFGNYNNSINFKFTGLYSLDNGTNYEYANDLEKYNINPNEKNKNHNIILSCGAVKRHITNNIYDLFGNLHEMTTRYGKGYCEAVGGTYNDIHSITKTKYSYPTNVVGFRVVLYII